jgi:hypothetical protein
MLVRLPAENERCAPLKDRRPAVPGRPAGPEMVVVVVVEVAAGANPALAPRSPADAEREEPGRAEDRSARHRPWWMGEGAAAGDDGLSLSVSAPLVVVGCLVFSVAAATVGGCGGGGDEDGGGGGGDA